MNAISKIAADLPFDIAVESCPFSDCDIPISVGNVLALDGGVPDLIGHVVVVRVAATSFTFMALPDHEAGRGGTVTFSMETT